MQTVLRYFLWYLVILYVYGKLIIAYKPENHSLIVNVVVDSFSPIFFFKQIIIWCEKNTNLLMVRVFDREEDVVGRGLQWFGDVVVVS